MDVQPCKVFGVKSMPLEEWKKTDSEVEMQMYLFVQLVEGPIEWSYVIVLHLYGLFSLVV